MNGRTPPESACNRIAAARPAVALDGTKIHIADIASRTGGKEINMAKDTHVTAPTRFIEANGIRYAYRRFGSESGTPLVFLQHFRGGLDNWDPLVTDGLAQGRPVILFNNAGVASSSGETPNTIEAMGDHVAAFVNALGLPQVDVLGFSIGGYVAQSFVLRHPNLVRRLVLAGTGPRNGEPSKNSRVLEVAGNPVPVCEDFCFSSSRLRKQVRRPEGHFGIAVISARMLIRLRRFRP